MKLKDIFSFTHKYKMNVHTNIGNLFLVHLDFQSRDNMAANLVSWTTKPMKIHLILSWWQRRLVSLPRTKRAREVQPPQKPCRFTANWHSVTSFTSYYFSLRNKRTTHTIYCTLNSNLVLPSFNRDNITIPTLLDNLP